MLIILETSKALICAIVTLTFRKPLFLPPRWMQFNSLYPCHWWGRLQLFTYPFWIPTCICSLTRRQILYFGKGIYSLNAAASAQELHGKLLSPDTARANCNSGLVINVKGFSSCVFAMKNTSYRQVLRVVQLLLKPHLRKLEGTVCKH